jgi:hypothetical protein
MNEIERYPVYLIAPRGRKTAIIRTLSNARRGAKKGEQIMKCTICKEIVNGKFHAFIDIDNYCYPVCKDCLIKYDKVGTKSLGNKIREKIKEKKNK